LGLIGELRRMLGFWRLHRYHDLRQVRVFAGYMLWCETCQVGVTTRGE